jgi:hypothetical protein
MLGMAANSSIAPATGRWSQAGAISAMNTATPKLTGTARVIAMVELISVPAMNASAPNRWVTGFQAVELRNPQMPNALMAVRLSYVMAITVAKSDAAARNAASTAAVRNTASPAGRRDRAVPSGSPVAARTAAGSATSVPFMRTFQRDGSRSQRRAGQRP